MFTWAGPFLSFLAFHPDDYIMRLIRRGDHGKAHLAQFVGDGFHDGGRVLAPSFSKGDAFNKQHLGCRQGMDQMFHRLWLLSPCREWLAHPTGNAGEHSKREEEIFTLHVHIVWPLNIK
jgi:hypothetical protein